MKINNFLLVICCLMCLSGRVKTVSERHRVFALNEHWVCNIKKSCTECLQLPHCSWCRTENKCFSKQLSQNEYFCDDNTTEYVDHGLSVDGNAQCACSSDEMEARCQPPGIDATECSGRGQCICGRCVCDPNTDPQNPTKMVMGEFCEYDNFSCDGLKCNEGPYLLNDPFLWDLEMPEEM